MDFQVDYSPLDRLIHRIAFLAPAVQLTAADIEKAAFSDAYKSARAARPIFITSLPRAGTTLLLEVLYRFPSLAAHVYRDMPFVMSPVLWARLSGAFRKRSQPQERAHGDGIQIGYDSPEAFEEVIWRTFWPEKYTGTGIALWRAADGKDEGRDFLLEHMKKIIALRRPDRLRDGRYISKNNANIARLELIGGMFPDAKILVPVRHPLEHAYSMFRQHQNFVEMQRKDPFVLRYMADLGHYEFGALHRPIAFPGLSTLVSGTDTESVDYWLGYWIAAFEYVLAHSDQIVLVSYEAACTDGRVALKGLCERLDIPEEGALEEAAALFRAAPPPRSDGIDFSPRLRARADELHEALVDRATGGAKHARQRHR